MRFVLAAAVLALPAAMLPAQALHTGVSHLVASVDAPEFAFQANAVKVAVPHVYTGLIAPVRQNALALAAVAPKNTDNVTVQFTVDTAGVPKDVQVVTPVDAQTQQQIVAAVSRVRYTPGKLNGTAVDTPMVLHIAFKN